MFGCSISRNGYDDNDDDDGDNDCLMLTKWPENEKK